MSNFFDLQRMRRMAMPNGGRRQQLAVSSAERWRPLWERTRNAVGSMWQPKRAVDAALPPWVHMLVGLSDDGLRVPGTRFRLGLDALLGLLLPGAGDALGGVTAAMLMYVAWKRGAPAPLLYKMLGNAALDIGLGSVPVVGDIFDVGFHANRRNLDLLEGHLKARSKPARASWLSGALAFGLLGALMLLTAAGLVALIVFGWRAFQH